jgi:hypothetical protein
MILGVAMALLSREVGWIPRQDWLWTIGVALTPYVAIILAGLLFNTIRAPVKLNNRRIRRIKLLRKSLKLSESELVQSRAQAQVELQAVKDHARRDPATEHYYRAAEQAISQLSDVGKNVLKLIHSQGQLFAGEPLKALATDELPVDDILKSLLGEIAITAREIVRQKRQMNRTREDLWWEITPGFREVVGEILFRPVTPPQV